MVKDYKIRLENFYGPLDLLLHLVKQDELDITKISLSKVADQYIAFLQAAKRFNIELAGEFLVVASQLMLIKSRRLLPEAEPDQVEELSMELIRRLLEYKLYKRRALLLGELYAKRCTRYSRPPARRERGHDEEVLVEPELWDILSSYARLVREVTLDVGAYIVYDDRPVEIFVRKILEQLRLDRSCSFSALLRDSDSKQDVIGMFLALLELVRENVVRVNQLEGDREIKIELAHEGLRGVAQSGLAR